MSVFGKTDTKVPGGVYLCQVNERTSCGACCGLYNVADPSYEAIVDMLTYRTDVFARVPRDIDSILAFKEKIETEQSEEGPLPKFHHCPYIGLVGRKHSRVGCLLHPSCPGNKGIDFRGLSYYGGMACRVYFCPSYYHLRRPFREIVCKAAEHWYLYGLVVTEARMLNSFFEHVEKRCNRPVTGECVLESEECLQAVQEFFKLKLGWPFRHQSFPGLGNYFFRDRLYPRPAINYEAIGEIISKYDTILRELVSCFTSSGELRHAEHVVDGLIDKFATNIS